MASGKEIHKLNGQSQIYLRTYGLQYHLWLRELCVCIGLIDNVCVRPVRLRTEHKKITLVQDGESQRKYHMVSWKAHYGERVLSAIIKTFQLIYYGLSQRDCKAQNCLQNTVLLKSVRDFSVQAVINQHTNEKRYFHLCALFALGTCISGCSVYTQP